MAKTAQKVANLNVWNSRQGSLVIGLVALAAAYIMASRAIHTGSLQQYALTFTLVVIGSNRLLHAARNQ